MPEFAHSAKILIVDDVKFSRKVLESAFLAHRMSNLREAGDGGEALKAIAEWQPDAVLLDLMMPGIDGEGVCRALKDMQLPHQPVIIVQTSVEELASKHRLFALGVTDYVTKSAGVSFMDSAALGMLLLLRDWAVRKGAAVTLAHPQGQVKKLFAVSRFNDLFRIEE